MSLEENKALVNRYIDELQNKGNPDAVDEFLSPNYVNHMAGPGQDAGVEGTRQFVGMMGKAFPDLHAEIHAQFAEGDDVVTHKTIHGTHKGDYMGVAATGKHVEIKVIDILRVSGGKITDHWAVADPLPMLEALGIVSRK